MRRFQTRHILTAVVLCAAGGVLGASVPIEGGAWPSGVVAPIGDDGTTAAQPADSATTARYPVAPTYDDNPAGQTHSHHPADLRTPSNIRTEVEYDWQTDSYTVRTKIGDTPLGYTIPMTKQQYMNHTERVLRAAYFREQNQKAYEAEVGDAEGLDLLDMKFSLGPAEKIFGKGGIRVRTQGSASLSTGIKNNKVDNPTLSERARNQTSFDFDEDIRLNMNASIGSKMSFNLNYNTEATFDFDANQFKLAFAGEEDDIIKSLEAGNVTMSTGSSLINGGAALFGVKAGLKFGRLNVTALLAKQESSSKTVSSRGGATKRTFEIQADQYDENRHYFLAQYFHDTYDQNMARLPLVASGVEITKVEVWVTNKRSSYDNARNIVAFQDLGEAEYLANEHWESLSTTGYPENKANTLYGEITTTYSDIRDITNVTTTLSALEAVGVTGGTDFEKVESARLLSASEYTLNSALGYISLKSKLDDDMVLAVAFQYTKGGKTYQVGEFSTDNAGNTTQTLVVKLLKATAGNPRQPMWHLMMKNIYSLGATSLQHSGFTMQVQYMSDTVGVYTNYINDGPIAQQLLIRVMNLDRLNANQESHSDGQFDWVDGYTVQASSGRIIFPVVEPFGQHLATKLGDDALAERYCYYELYDSTLTVAQQVAEKNKFRLKGEYSASSGSEIDLGAMNVARSSVRVTAGGTELVENADYTVDYTMGVVTILNESIIESGTQVSVSLEDQSDYSLQRKSMMGLDLQYDFSKDLQVGGTVIRLTEKPLTKKVSMTDIPIANTIYGFNLKWNKDFMWLTNAVGSIPWVKATEPSNISVSAEFAQLVAGHSDEIGNAGNVYLDDFESSETPTDISSASSWQLASTPYDNSASALFPEAALSNNIEYGKNRALFTWYTVERLFTSQSSSLTPGHIKNDLEQLSDHRVRQINYDEIYPNKQLEYGETGILNVLNLSFYPEERGPYNMDVDGMGNDGRLLNPERRWGGMMRSLDVTNFENANYEYIEFWLMDPFIDYDGSGSNADNEGGDLYFNLGEVSEDILKDGMKSFENGLSTDGDTTYTTSTVWGRVSRRTSTVYAFDNTSSSHAQQDVGLDGLGDDDEHRFPTYQNYVEQVSTRVDGSTLSRWQSDPFSPINDPAGDNYHFYRGGDYDAAQATILERYKHYRGTEGNSPSTSDAGESYSTAAKATPDVEDINSDNTLNEYERYFQYHISLRPADMQVGHNHIESISEVKRTLRNGKQASIKWYQFKIPLAAYDKKIGTIQNFKSIRFMRLFMTGWKREQTLRLATLELVRSDWRNYTASRLTDRGYAVSGTGSLATSTVNIEENAGSYPVNYVLPPGVDRIQDPGQATATQLNEQAMVMSVSDLEPHDAVAVYKNSGVDMRQYERLQLFVHGEALPDDATLLASGDLAVFVRLGSDYKDNYYEYEVPLQLTPAGSYNNNSTRDRETVWPTANMIDLDLRKLTSLKKQRNSEKQRSLSNVSFTTLYTDYDSDRPQNKMTVIGNPTLSEVSVIMIGVRNNGRTVKSGKVWVNELRLQGIDESGGLAAKANATLRVSSLATINASGNYTSAGFGSIEQSTAERPLDNKWQYTVSGQTDLGKWLPAQVKLTAPFYYSRSKAVTTPEYDPYNEDLLLDETLDSYHHDRQKDSIRTLVQTVDKTTSLALSGVKFDVKSKKPKPWDPANVTMAYSQNRTDSHDPTTEYERQSTHKASINYQWTPYFTPIAPWKQQTQTKGRKTTAKESGSKDDKKVPKLLSDFQLNWLPNSISLSSQVNRTYHEEQLRNVETYESDYTIPVTYSKTFTWLRQTAIAWDLTKTLKFNFASATNARIDEPDAPVNKNLYPDEYEAWKDTILQNLWKLGTPVSYNQTFDASWNVPLQAIPALDWAQTSVKYKANYEWNRGTVIDAGTSTGNALQNSAAWQWDGRFNLESLYNKSAFLKKANERLSASAGRPATAKTTKKTTGRPEKRGKSKYEDAITLTPDGLELQHNLGTRRVLVAARVKAVSEADTLVNSPVELPSAANDSVAATPPDSLTTNDGVDGPATPADSTNAPSARRSRRMPQPGRAYRLSYRRVDDNTIRLRGADSVALDVTITPAPPLDEQGWYKSLQVAARLLTMVRSVQIGYRYQRDTYLPSFRPNVGDFYGQNNTDGGMAPGLGFAFGLEGGESYTRKAIDNGWLIINDSLTTPAVYSWTKDFSYQAVVEPLPGLKINLTGTHKHNQRQSHQFMFDDMAIQKSGSFQMTTIALGSSFGGSRSSKKYRSAVFDRFLTYRQVIYDRLMARYEGTTYPRGGFMADYAQQAGTPYGGMLGSSRINSSDVLVPAFLAAYTGGDAHSISLSPFPKLWQTLPNWNVSYDGLTSIIPWLSGYFRAITFSHAYTCTYNVGSYSTYTNYVENGDGLGFTLDVANDVPVPSSEFDIASVTLSESFAPLAGINATTNNNISVRADYRYTRALTLNMSSAQLTENVSKDLTVGLGYKIENFAAKIGLPGGKDRTTTHDLNLSFDVTHKNQVALLRKIEDQYSEATSGNKAWAIRLSADYQFSRMLTMRLYYDKQINEPIISSSYPTSSADFGMTMSFSLTR